MLNHQQLYDQNVKRIDQIHRQAEKITELLARLETERWDLLIEMKSLKHQNQDLQYKRALPCLLEGEPDLPVYNEDQPHIKLANTNEERPTRIAKAAS